MILVPPKKIITSPFRQRGNIVSVFPKPPPPAIPPAKAAATYSLKESQGNPETISGLFRFDVFFKPDGTRVWIWRTGSTASTSFRQYDVSPAWSITPGSWTATASQFLSGSLARTFQWNDDGTILTTLARWFSSFRRLDSFDQSATPYDVTVLGPAIGFVGLPGGEFSMHWKPGGLIIYIDRASGLVEAFPLTTPYDITTKNATPVQSFDTVPEAGARSMNLEISEDGKFLYSVTSTNFLCSWELPTPFDVSGATNFSLGLSVILPTPLQIPRGMNIRPDNLDIFLFRDQNLQNARIFSTP